MITAFCRKKILILLELNKQKGTLKIHTLLFNLIFLMMGGIGFCQTSATANFTASATIIQPIGIKTTSNMDFAGIDAQSGGTVTLTPESNRSTTGGVALAGASMVSAATFEVTGQAGYTFSISLPRKKYLLSSGNENMVLRDFTSSQTGEKSFDAGSRTIRVGATLDVDPHQKPGRYMSTAPITITVDYN